METAHLDGFGRRTARKQAQVLAAARELFTRRGFAAVSMAELAAAAGVSPVSVYTWFGSKAGLARAVFAELLATSLRDFEALLDADLPFATKLATILDAKEQSVLDGRTSTFHAEAWADPAIRELVAEAIDASRADLYRRFAEQGRAAGVIDPDIPLDAVLDYLQCVSALMLEEGFQERDEAYRLGVLHLVIRGLTGRGPAS